MHEPCTQPSSPLNLAVGNLESLHVDLKQSGTVQLESPLQHIHGACPDGKQETETDCAWEVLSGIDATLERQCEQILPQPLVHLEPTYPVEQPERGLQMPYSPNDTTAPNSLMGTQLTVMPATTPPLSPCMCTSSNPINSNSTDVYPSSAISSQNVVMSGSASTKSLKFHMPHVGLVGASTASLRAVEETGSRALPLAPVVSQSSARFPLSVESRGSIGGVASALSRASNSPPPQSRPSPPSYSRQLHLAWGPVLPSRGMPMTSTPLRIASPRQDQHSPMRQVLPTQHLVQQQPELRHAQSHPQLRPPGQPLPSWNFVSLHGTVAASRRTPAPQR